MLRDESRTCGIETARGQAELVQPARHSIGHTNNPNRAHESRTESEAKSMAKGHDGERFEIEQL